MICENCNPCLHRVGWIGLFVSVLVVAFTISIGLMNNSKALMAASLCSGIDIASSLTVILGLKLSGKSIDLKHPYGHGKIEFLVVGCVSILLIISAALLLFSSIKSIYYHDNGPDQWITLTAALVVTVINEIKHRYAKCVGLHFGSPAIITLAEHARVDAFSSAAVVIAVVCARIGLHFVDPLIAIFEVGHILKASIKMLLGSLKNLMDVSIPHDNVTSIKKIVSEVKGVLNINYLRARQIGPEIWIELSIFVDPEISLLEGNNIAENTRSYLINKMDHIGNVQVHYLSKPV